MLFIDDKRTTMAEVIKMLTNKSVEPGKDGKPNDYKVRNEITGQFSPDKIFRFTFLEGDVRPDVDNPRKGIQLPASKSFEAFYTITDSFGDSHVLRYATSNPRKDKNQKLEYTPQYLEITERGVLEVRKEPELALFLYYHTLNAESGNNVPGGIKMFKTFIGQKRAAKNVEKQELVFRVKNLILNPQERLDDEQLRTLAETFIAKKVPNNFYSLTEMEIEEVKDELLRLCEVDPYKMWNFYLSMDNKYRSMIKKYREAKVLTFIPGDLSWRIINDGGQDEVMTTVPLKHDSMEWVINFLIDDRRGFQTKLDNLLEKALDKKEKKQVPA